MNIWIAASDGRTDLVEQFLNNGLSANSRDPNGYTPIHAAASYAHTELLRKLCSEPYNGDINVRDSDGDTPLHHCEDVNAAKVIIEELGGDYKLTNDEGKTALEAFEEDGEFPELIQYMRQVSGAPSTEESFGIDKEQLAQFENSIRYTLENEPVDENDSEGVARRQKLEQILQGENVEQELESYVRELVRGQIFGEDVENNKRRREWSIYFNVFKLLYVN